jgi:transmembrane sensor
VEAGKRLTIALEAGLAAATPAVISREEITTRLSWRETRVEFSRTPLAVAVEQMNRRSKVQLILDDPELARMPVTGLFRADNTETLVRLLEANFGVKADRNGETITLRKDNLGNP